MSPQVLGAFALFPLPRSNKQQGLIAKTMGQGELANEANERRARDWLHAESPFNNEEEETEEELYSKTNRSRHSAVCCVAPLISSSALKKGAFLFGGITQYY